MEEKKLYSELEERFALLLKKYKDDKDLMEMLELYPLIISKNLSRLSNEEIKDQFIKAQGVVEFRDLLS